MAGEDRYFYNSFELRSDSDTIIIMRAFNDSQVIQGFISQVAPAQLVLMSVLASHRTMIALIYSKSGCYEFMVILDPFFSFLDSDEDRGPSA